MTDNVLHFSCHRLSRVRKDRSKVEGEHSQVAPSSPPHMRSLRRVYITPRTRAAIRVTIPPAVGASIATPCCLPPRNSAGGVSTLENP